MSLAMVLQTIRFMVGFPPACGLPAWGMQAPTSSERWLLLVDDDRDAVESLQLLLELQIPGTTVRATFDGQAGADLARSAETPPAAVVLDMEMPVLDGWGAAARIRAEAVSTPPLLIGVSGAVVRLASALKCGLIDHALVKPVDTAELLRILTEGPAGQSCES